MKTKNLLTLGLFTAALGLVSCDTAPKGDAALVGDAQDASGTGERSLAIDGSASSIQFTGYGVGKNHPGVFELKEGAVEVRDNQVIGGSFVIDIKSMDLLQTESFIDEKLLPHLLSADFFDVEKFPEASFEITGIVPYTPGEGETVVEGANHKVSGNLKLRDLVKNITFPASIVVEDDVVKAKANFDIDRTDWGMHYNNDKSLKDSFISPTVNVVLNLATKS